MHIKHVTLFIAVFSVFRWPRTEPAVSPRSACIEKSEHSWAEPGVGGWDEGGLA